MTFDVAGLDALAAELRAVKVSKIAGPVISRAGGNMVRAAREAAPGGPYLPNYARSIQSRKDGPLAVEVFAAGEGQGELSAILEFGQGRNGPHPHILPQLEPEADATLEWLARVLGEAL